jgi:WD40 repeat protein
VEEEIAYFRTLPQRNNISIALAEGEFDDPSPGRLDQYLPNIAKVDMRRKNRSRADLANATLNFVAMLFDIKQGQLPELRREDAKRRASRLWRLVLAISLVILTLSGLLFWGIALQNKNRLEEGIAKHNLSQFYRERASAVQDSQPAKSLAYLAGALRQDSDNLPAQAILNDLLLNRSWPLLTKEFRPPRGQAVRYVSNDGKLFCTTENGILQLWTTASLKPFGSPIPFGQGASLIAGCNVAQDRLLTETDHRYIIWDVRSGKTTGEPIEIGDSYNQAQSLDGRWVADVTDKNVTFLDVARGTRWVVRNPSDPDAVISEVYFSPTGDKALVAGAPKVTILDLIRSAQIGQMVTHASSISKAAVSPDGYHYALVGQFEGLMVGALRGKVEQVREGIWENVEFTRDGSNIITTGRGGGITIWSYNPLRAVMSAAEEQHASALSFSRESGLLALDSTGSISLWRSTGGSPIREFIFQAGNGTPIAKDLVASISGNAALRIWQISDRKTQKSVKDIQLPPEWSAVVPIFMDDDEGIGSFDDDFCGNKPFHQTARLLAVPNGDKIEVFDKTTGLTKAVHPLNSKWGDLIETQAGTTWAAAAQMGQVDWHLSIWEEIAGHQEERSLLLTDRVSCFKLSADSHKVVVRIGKRLEVWDTTAGTRLGKPIQHGAQTFKFFEFDPNGENILTFSEDGAFVLWNASSGRALDGSLARGSDMSVARLSPDGKRIATVTRAGVLQIREISTGIDVFTPRKLPYAIYSLEFAPSGESVLVLSGRQIRLVSGSTGVVLGEPISIPRRISRIVINRDGRRLLLAAGLGCRIWDLQTGIPLGTTITAGPSTPIADFSADGQRLWIVGRKNLYSWDTPVFPSEEAHMLADLAEAVSGYLVDGQKLRLLSDQADRLNLLRRRTATAALGEPTASALIRWFLADPGHRSRSPLTKP